MVKMMMASRALFILALIVSTFSLWPKVFAASLYIDESNMFESVDKGDKANKALEKEDVFNGFLLTDFASALSYPKSICTLQNKAETETFFIVAERDGALVVVDESGEYTRHSLPVEDLYTEGQGGVLDILITRQFSQNGLILVSYSKGNASDNRLAVVKANLSLTSGVSNIETVFEVGEGKDTPVHYGGKLLELAQNQFLVTVGDGFDYREQAQLTRAQLGKVLGFKLDGQPLSTPPFSQYPFVYTLGHRNPQGVVHGFGGNIYLHEHGPDGGDELNLLEPGANYGWPVVTLGKDYSGARISPFTHYPGMTDPLVDWTPSIAPSSMVYYTHGTLKPLQNTLLITALKAKQLFSVAKTDTGFHSSAVFESTDFRLRDITVNRQGHLFILTDGENAKIIKVTAK